jgi:hypothetical protein
MSRSFFTTDRDADLYAGSAAFAAQLAADPGALGVPESDAAEYVALDAAYAAAYLAVASPATRTPGAYAAKADVRAALCRKAAAVSRVIAGNATVTDAQRIVLGLSVRKQPSPMPPPGTPNGFRVALLNDGSVELTWTCRNPTGSTGTVYHVYRRAAAGGAFAFLGATGRKRFADAAIPAGATALTYQVQAVRSTAVGPAARFNVNFGGTALPARQRVAA